MGEGRRAPELGAVGVEVREEGGSQLHAVAEPRVVDEVEADADDLFIRGLHDEFVDFIAEFWGQVTEQVEVADTCSVLGFFEAGGIRSAVSFFSLGKDRVEGLIRYLETCNCGSSTVLGGLGESAA